ncbi:MAG: hypothetical protein ACI30M_07000 [Muribaculaceae bacterium]
MKLKFFFLISFVAFLVTSCSDDDNAATVADIQGVYEGYTIAECKYFSGTITENESVTISENADGTAKITYTSQTWGTVIIPSAKLIESGGVYALSGTGETQMGMEGNIKTYACSFIATIMNKSEAGMEFSVPAVMGGLTITFSTGTPPISE